MEPSNPEDLLTDDKLEFISEYLNNNNKEDLRERVLDIYRETKQQVINSINNKDICIY
jgi:hypothetical protein